MGYLDPATRRRLAALLLIVGALIAAAALANVGPFSNPPTEADRASAALKDFFAATRHKDFRAACGQMTAAGRSQVEIRAAALAGNRTGCPNVLDSALGLTLARTRVEIIDVRVSGNAGAVDAKLRVPGAKRAQLRTYKLEEIGGRWRISDVSL